MLSATRASIFYAIRTAPYRNSPLAFEASSAVAPSRLRISGVERLRLAPFWTLSICAPRQEKWKRARLRVNSFRGSRHLPRTSFTGASLATPGATSRRSWIWITRWCAVHISGSYNRCCAVSPDLENLLDELVWTQVLARRGRIRGV